MPTVLHQTRRLSTNELLDEVDVTEMTESERQDAWSAATGEIVDSEDKDRCMVYVEVPDPEPTEVASDATGASATPETGGMTRLS